MQKLAQQGAIDAQGWEAMRAEITAMDPALGALIPDWDAFLAGGNDASATIMKILTELNALPPEILVNIKINGPDQSDVNKASTFLKSQQIWKSGLKGIDVYDKAAGRPRDFSVDATAKVDGRIKAAEAASKAADKSHKAEQEACKARCYQGSHRRGAEGD
jgi:hypothetical protein